MGATEQVESKKLASSPSRSRSVCCCCCRRQPRDEMGQDERNGIRLALYSETLPTNESDQAIPTIKTFQQDLTGAERQDSPLGRKKCAKKCVKCCKKFTTFLFSNIGLCSAVVAYSILGGFIFQNLEAPSEVLTRDLKRREVMLHRKRLAEELWDLVDDPVIFFHENFTHMAESILIKYQTAVLNAKQNGWDGMDSDEDNAPKWSFAGSLLYSVTVITTIGNALYSNVETSLSRHNAFILTF